MISRKELQNQIDTERQQLVNELNEVNFFTLYEEYINSYVQKKKYELMDTDSINVYIDFNIIYKDYKIIGDQVRHQIKKGLKNILQQYLKEETAKLARSAEWVSSNFYISKDCIDFTLTVGEKI